MRPSQLPAPGDPEVLYLIDLSGYIFRAYHAISPLTSASGEPTHATYGTVSMLAKLVEERKPGYLAVAMDAPGKTFREALDARYKAHRPPAPADLVVQMKRCKEIVEAYRIPIFVQDGLEADDLIASIVAEARARKLRVVIASSDKDLMQLVDDDRVLMWDAMRDRVFGTPEVIAKFGVPPEKVRDVLALIGDASDNVPGVPGIGAKTAAELLTQFDSLDAMYQALDQIKKVRIRDSLVTHEGEARLSQKLVTLSTDLKVELDLQALRYGGADTERLREIFAELGFSRFLKMLPAPASSPALAPVPRAEAAYGCIRERAELEAWVNRAKQLGRFAIDVRATTTDAMNAHLCGIALCCEPGRAFYVPIGHRYLGAPSQLDIGDIREVLGPLLVDPNIERVGHDIKFSEVLLLRSGVPMGQAAFDTMLASYLLDPERSHELPFLAERDAAVHMVGIETLLPKRKDKTIRLLDDVEIDQAAGFAAAYADLPMTLLGSYKERIAQEKLTSVLEDIELPLSSVLARMEYEGVLIDRGALLPMSAEMSQELSVLEQKAREMVGQEFNLASPKQVETVLFDVLGLHAARKTKTGRSTDAEVLEALVDEHPLPAIVLEHRAISKLKGTYVDALPRLIHGTTGRIHTRWSQAVAATGRLSSQDPNLQNIPIRTRLGKLIRKAFTAPPGFVFMSADYSQIELRVLAHLSKDPVLVDAFRKGEDVHVRTAMEIFSVAASDVTEEMRRQSKTINFGVIYGMGETALGKRLGIPRAQAAKFIDAYYERYRGVYEFMDRTLKEAQKTEAVRTLLGRRRLLPDLRSSDRMRRAQAERIAQNTPIQGTAADLLKLAMVKLGSPIVPGAKMVLTVHDELAFEIPESAVQEAAEKIRTAMETVYPMDVPLEVDLGWGLTWADVK